MDATSTSNKTSELFIKKLAGDYPQFKFKEGSTEHWSPKTGTITYDSKQQAKQLRFGLLHELAHALLAHSNYQSDFELLKMESEAWQLAAKIGKRYHVQIDRDHIENCLDTYRDWLHQRSECPTCGTHVLQSNASTYHCFNCQTEWRVSSGRFARPYRRTA